MWFFRMGEEVARHMSFWAAYKLWRNANPAAIFDDAAKIHVLNEADRFTGNMSTVGMSELQRFGPTGIATTFWGYNMRIWEQLSGLDRSNLSAWQKSKVFANWMAVNSLIFGVPATVGTATFNAIAALPYGGNVFRWFIDNRTKENEDKNQFATDMNNLEDNHKWLFDLIFKGAIHKIAPGTNITERLSPGGNRFFSELLGDKEMWEILLGASASPVRDTILATSPFLTMITDTFRPAEDKVGIEIGLEDIERVVNAVGGRQVSAYMRSYWALSTHRLMSNQRMTIDGLSRGEQFIFSLTGLVPERVEQAYNITKNEKSLVELQQFHNKYIREEWRNQLRAVEEDRIEDIERHQRNIRAHIILGHYRPDQLQRVVADLMGDRGSTVDNIFQRFSTQSPRHARFYNEYLRMLGEPSRTRSLGK
jgi:hypothetical protein